MQSAELGEGMWGRKPAREEKGLGWLWGQNIEKRESVKYSGGNAGLDTVRRPQRGGVTWDTVRHSPLWDHFLILKMGRLG